MESDDGRAPEDRPEADSVDGASSSSGPFGQRASKSADGARERMRARLRAMTPRERMIRALSLAEQTDEILHWIGRPGR